MNEQSRTTISDDDASLPAESGKSDGRPLTAAVLDAGEDDFDKSLRPRNLSEFVGQERVREQLSIALEATKTRREALDHVLLAGPPGLGKTSLAYIISKEIGTNLNVISGPAIEKKGDLAAILTFGRISITTF